MKSLSSIEALEARIAPAHVALLAGPGATIAADGKSAKYTDNDGDLVTVLITRGTLDQSNFHFGADQTLNLLDLHAKEFALTDLHIAAVKPTGGTGDGRANVGALDAHGIDLGVVTVSGDLGQIDAGDDHFTTPGVVSLTVGSLGAVAGTQDAATLSPLRSDITGKLGSLIVKRSLNGFLNVSGGSKSGIGSVSVGSIDGSAGGAEAGLIRTGGNIGPVLVLGSVTGGAELSGIVSGGKLGTVSIGGALTSADAAHPVTISALGKLSPATQLAATAIAGVSIKTNVLNARILAGYNSSLGALNAEGSIGAIVVGGTWSASSIAAGVADTSTGGQLSSGPDGYGRNDTLGAENTNGAIYSRIASVTIKGAAMGSTTAGDSFGIEAQRVGAVSIKGKVIPKTGTETLLDAVNGDFRIVKF